MSPPVFLLTDYGVTDHYAGQVRAVIAGYSPASAIHDLSHGVAPFAIDEGAWLLETARPYLPPGCVVLAVVDPAVGTTQRHGAARDRDGRMYLGPDNGLLSCLLSDSARRAHGGRSAPADEPGVEFRRLDERQLGIEPPAVSATFHGRDLYAPAAGMLAAGRAFESVGDVLEALCVLPPFEGASGRGGALSGRVIHIDRFGSLITTIRGAQVEAGGKALVRIGGAEVTVSSRTFAGNAPGDLFWLIDSSGYISVAMNQGSAADRLGTRRGDPVLVDFR